VRRRLPSGRRRSERLPRHRQNRALPLRPEVLPLRPQPLRRQRLQALRRQRRKRAVARAWLRRKRAAIPARRHPRLGRRRSPLPLRHPKGPPSQDPRRPKPRRRHRLGRPSSLHQLGHPSSLERRLRARRLRLLSPCHRLPLLGRRRVELRARRPFRPRRCRPRRRLRLASSPRSRRRRLRLSRS